MKFTIKQIEVFLATARHQNITHAANELSMSQSAASESLKTLEEQFNIKLFDRVGKKLQLNQLGNTVRQQAEVFLDHAKNLEDVLKSKNNHGNIKVGATLSIGNYLAVTILSDFRSAFPGANASLEVANTTEIAKRVAGFELDIGLIEGEVAHPDLDVIPWRDDELVVFCAPSHPYAKLKNLDDEALTKGEWVLRETGSGTRQAFDYAMHGLLSKLDITLELQHTEAIKRAVENGLGLGCLSKITLVDAFKRGTLVPLQVPQRDFHRKFYFILQKHKYRSAGITNWISLCMNYQLDK